VSSSSSPDIVDGFEAPNTIYDNGLGLQQENRYGAEIYASSSSYPDINENNIYDLDGNDDPRGIMVYKSSTCDDGIDATENFWGVEDTSEIDDDWFYWHAADTRIDWEPAHDELIDDVCDYKLGKRFMREEEYETAIDSFSDYLSNNPNSDRSVSAIQLVFFCNIHLDADLSELREWYLDISEDEDYSDRIRWYARKLSIACLIREERYEDAGREYADALEDAPNAEEEILIQIDQVQLQEMIDNGNGIDNAEKTDLELERLELELSNIQDDLLGSESGVPIEFGLSNAYPNPFNGFTRFQYNITDNSPVKMNIYDISGREIKSLVNYVHEPGSYVTTWNAFDQPSGMYFCTMQAQDQIRTVKVILIK